MSVREKKKISVEFTILRFEVLKNQITKLSYNKENMMSFFNEEIKNKKNYDAGLYVLRFFRTVQ